MNKPLSIGVAIGGGMGDLLNVTALTHGLKRQFPNSVIKMYINRHPEVCRNNRTIAVVEVVDWKAWDHTIKESIDKHDIFVFVRYPVKYFFKDSVLENKEIRSFKEHWESRYKRHYEKMWEEFLNNISRIDKFCVDNDMTAYDLRRDSSCLEYTDDDQYISLTEDDMATSNSLDGLRIVTVNNSGAYGDMTKSWNKWGWEKVIKHLKARGIFVVQLGTAKEANLPFINSRFYGTFHETAAVLKRSLFHVGIEGGIIHLNKAVGHKSVVLFGPTPVPTFGYRENINLRGSFCKPCWWHNRSIDWNTTCDLTKQKVSVITPGCMLSLQPNAVIEAVDKMLIERGVVTKKGISK